jgi:hypothetical protein
MNLLLDQRSQDPARVHSVAGDTRASSLESNNLCKTDNAELGGNISRLQRGKRLVD